MRAKKQRDGYVKNGKNILGHILQCKHANRKEQEKEQDLILSTHRMVSKLATRACFLRQLSGFDISKKRALLP